MTYYTLKWLEMTQGNKIDKRSKCDEPTDQPTDGRMDGQFGVQTRELKKRGLDKEEKSTFFRSVIYSNENELNKKQIDCCQMTGQ